MVVPIQIKRTATPGFSPTGLRPGELSVEMANPTRLWVGVPSSIDPSERKLIGGGIALGDAPPMNPAAGQLWWETDSGVLWFYYDDGNSKQWVQVNNGGNTGGGATGEFLPLVGGNMSGDIIISKGAPGLFLNNTEASAGGLVGMLNSTRRWILQPGDGTVEGGGNTGTNFLIYRYDDLGVINGTPVLKIDRSTGISRFSSPIEIGPDPMPTLAAGIKVSYPGTTVQNGIALRPAADESTALLFYNAAGTAIGNIYQTALTVAYNTGSSGEHKEDLKEFDSGRIIDSTNVYDFAWKGTTDRSYGVIAQQAMTVYPMAVTHVKMSEGHDYWGVDYSKYVPVLLREMKSLRERVSELESALLKLLGKKI